MQAFMTSYAMQYYLDLADSEGLDYTPIYIGEHGIYIVTV